MMGFPADPHLVCFDLSFIFALVDSFYEVEAF